MKYFIITILLSALFSIAALGQTFSYFNKTWGNEYNYLSFSSVVSVVDGYIVFGSYSDTLENSSFDLLKFDFYGNLVWRKNLCPEDDKESTILQKDMIKDDDGSIVMAGLVGLSPDPNTRDTRIIKINKDGEIIWKKDIGSEINESMSPLQKSHLSAIFKKSIYTLLDFG